MNEPGKLFRKLRQDRHLTLQQVADEHNSISFISKFENGDSQISFTRLIHLLGKINFSAEEFLYLLGKDSTLATKSSFLIGNPMFLSANFMTPLVILMRDLDSSKQQYENNPAKTMTYFNQKILELENSGTADWHHLLAILYQVQAELLKNDIDTNQPQTTDKRFSKVRIMMRPIISYLYNIENWSSFELLLFGISHYAMPLTTVHQLEKIAIKRTSINATFPIMPLIQGGLLFGLFSTYINFRKLDWARQTLHHLQKLVDQREDSNYAILLRFYQGWFDYINSDGKQGADKMQDAIDILHILHEPKMAGMLTQFVKLIKQNQKTPGKSMLFIM